MSGDGGPLQEIKGRARQFDDVWRAVMASDELAIIRRQLSIYELRKLINVVIDAACEGPEAS